MDKPVIIFGVNNIGRAAKAMFESNDIVIYGFLDDDKDLAGTEVDEVSVLGRTNDDGFLKLIGKKAEAFVATPNRHLLTLLYPSTSKIHPFHIFLEALSTLEMHAPSLYLSASLSLGLFV